MDKYFIKHIKPALKKYNLNLRDILEKGRLAKSVAIAFYPPEIDTAENWEIAHVKCKIAFYIIHGAKLFDEKKRVIRDYVGRN